MAIGDNNTVPLGQAGTGAAFVLGDSQVANQFVANQARNQQLAYQNQLAREKQAMANAKLYQDNQLKLKGGLLWQNDINALAQQDLNQGSQLMANGINPYRLNYNDPAQVQKGTDFLMQREGIKAKNDQRLGLIQEAQKVQASISKNPDSYEPEDIQKFNQWQAGSLDDAIKNPIPQVRPKFQPNKDLVPLLDPITFQTSKVVGNTKIAENKLLEEPTKTNIEALISGNEAGNRWIKRETGLTPSEAKNIPSTFEANKKDLLKQYKGDPSLRERLAAQYGITGEGQALDDLLNQQAQQNTLAKQKYNGIIDQYLNVARGKANEFLKTNPDFTIRNHQIAEERLKLAKDKEARISSSGGSKTDEDVYYTNQFIDKLLLGAKGDKAGQGIGEQLGGILDGKGYSKEWSLPNSESVQTKPYHVEMFTVDGKPSGKIKITVAPKIGEDGEEKTPPRSITINANDATNERSKINSFLKEVTGGSLGVKESQIRTNQASGKINQAQPTKTVPVSKIKSLVGKSGYEGYSEKELMDYYKSQGYTIK